jgi:hypothetical protein
MPLDQRQRKKKKKGNKQRKKKPQQTLHQRGKKGKAKEILLSSFSTCSFIIRLVVPPAFRPHLILPPPAPPLPLLPRVVIIFIIVAITSRSRIASSSPGIPLHSSRRRGRRLPFPRCYAATLLVPLAVLMTAQTAEDRTADGA